MKHGLKPGSAKTGNMPDSPILEIRDLCKVFSINGSCLNVLENISFNASEGEFICILGPSGCGKSTILKIISGFVSPESGRIMLNNRPVLKPGADRCMVFQEDALFPWLTVEENIVFGLKGKQDKDIIKHESERFLSLTGLTLFRDYLPHEISGGMKQRVALARVLILKPKVLLMDEPFGALDAQTREDMQNLLLSLWEKLSHTIIFVTHDVSEAVKLADRILVMDRNPGRIRERITVDLKRPRKIEDLQFHEFCKKVYNISCCK
ncbi:putative ABC transporter, ATP-binding protein [Desulfonema limicola]|uniref:ABC transporter, ATP-binding protein n=1 Tax=Desulfonema limicola TaxID=45656 RepID=A0A975B3X9_9BACT|nr:ABC transporter ATP-binding protein [Desulfonema limicola]QTA78350.1 putative ABC transporter, ATP-binding protein [Desulfonema limicola]